jgi:hypothetical protein
MLTMKKLKKIKKKSILIDCIKRMLANIKLFFYNLNKEKIE